MIKILFIVYLIIAIIFTIKYFLKSFNEISKREKTWLTPIDYLCGIILCLVGGILWPISSIVIYKMK